VNIPAMLYVIDKRKLDMIRPTELSQFGRVAFLVDEEFLQLEIDTARDQWPNAKLFLHGVATDTIPTLGCIRDGHLRVWFVRVDTPITFRHIVIA